MNLLFISLGCDKNLVDTEKMLGILGGEGYSFVDDESDADVIVAASSGMPRKRASTPSWRWQSLKRAAV